MELRTKNISLAGWTVLSIYGELDVATAPSLREQLIALVNEGQTHLVFDLEELDFLDSAGLGAIVGALKRVRTHDGELRLVCTQPRIQRVFQITGIDKALPLHASLDEAIDRG